MFKKRRRLLLATSFTLKDTIINGSLNSLLSPHENGTLGRNTFTDGQFCLLAKILKTLHSTSSNIADISVKGWYDGHPEIGKMQKDIFDDIFDTIDDGVAEEEDPEPIVPKPNNFEVSIPNLMIVRMAKV